MDGLWIAHFSAGAAHGSGIAVFRAGEILGADFAHVWTGTYEEEGSRIYARVRIAPQTSVENGEPLVPDQPVMVTLSGSMTGTEMQLAGHPDESEVAVSIAMHRAAV